MVETIPKVTNKKAVKAKAQFDRTVKRTGKWRGLTPEKYAAKYGASGFRSGRAIKECEHFFSDFEGQNRCIHCKLPYRKYVLAHPKKFPKIIRKIKDAQARRDKYKK